MENLKRALKIILIIIGFLFFNILIDIIAGSFVPGFVAQTVTGDAQNEKDFAAYGILSGQIAKLIILAVFIKIRDKSFRNNLNRSYIQGEKIGKPIKLVGVGLGTVGFGLLLTNIIMKAFAGTELLQSALDLMENAFKVNGPIDGLILILAVVVGAPVVEELLFRGVLYEEIRKETSLKITMFLTALIFGLYHFNILQTPNTFFMGLVLAYVYHKERSIKASIIVHAVNNSMVMVPILDQGLSPIGIVTYVALISIGLYSLKNLNKKQI